MPRGGFAMIRRRLVVTGKVQNVWYRDWLVGQARELGVDGWVRNRADGSVEAVAQGEPDLVEMLIDRARQGSPASEVAAVAATDDAPAETLQGFVKRPTV
jgi:acylphosphatase